MPALLKPILVDTTRLAPMTDRSMFGADCAHCGKPRARWVFRPDDKEGVLLMCSLCWLYESNWGKARLDDIDALVTDTEAAMKTPFPRTPSGRLLSDKDADRILAAICYLSKMQHITNVSQRMQ